MDEALGNKRPYTSWEAQGACKLPDYAWTDWAKVQTVSRAAALAVLARPPPDQRW